MKKFFYSALAISATLLSSSVMAEGYQVNTLSAKQLGMAHTGVSQKLNSESLWFNPAAAVFQQDKFTASASFTGIMAVAEFTGATSGETTVSDNDLSTPIFFSLNYKLDDDTSIGLSFNTPYGSSMNWGDSWEGAHLVQNIELTSYCVQPTISRKFLNDKLSVGVGLMVSWGSFNLSKSALPISTGYGMIYQVAYDGAKYSGMNDAEASALAANYAKDAEDAPLASVSLEGDAEVKIGVNIGLLYNPSEKWSVGASYRSKMMMEVDGGSSSVAYNETYISTLSALSSITAFDGATFSAQLPLPAVISLGTTYYPTDRWSVSADFQLTQWSTYEDLVFDFGFDDSSAEKNYHDALAVRLGGQYKVCDNFTARAGIYYDGSPVYDDYLSPETPSVSKMGYTCGLSYIPVSRLSIDLAYAYVSSLGGERTASCPDDTSSTSTFAGDYLATANVFSVGLSWGF